MHNSSNAPAPRTADAQHKILRYMLDGSTHAAALMPWEQVGPILLPAVDCDRVIRAHLSGSGADVQFAPMGKPSRMVRLDAVQINAYLPRADGLCGFAAVDLDGNSHGEKGLADPDAAARCFAERADSFGLLPGVMLVRSRSGAGRHIFLFPPDPIPQADATLAVAFLAAAARRIAGRDVDDCGSAHAFRSGSGELAQLGQAGAVELLPRSTERPERGYAIALPFGGAAAKRGGGVALDVFEHPPVPLQFDAIPRCDAHAWQRFMSEARRSLEQRTKRPPVHMGRSWGRSSRGPVRLDPRTQALLDGTMSEGGRNRAVYYGWRDLIRSGVSPLDAESVILAAAERCGLRRSDAMATVKSAQRRWGTSP